MVSSKPRAKDFIASVAIYLSFLPMAVNAATSTWVLSGVTFTDGGTAAGWFDYDPDTGTFSRWKITTGGGNTVIFPVFTYTVTNSTIRSFNAGDPQNMIIFSADMADMNFGNRHRNLRITPTAALTDAGGEIALDLATWGGGSGGVECYDCGPSRLIKSGSLRSAGAAGQTSLYLKKGRFKVEVDWRTAAGGEGSGRVVPFDVPFGEGDSGLFYFFTINNWEMLVKVLDGCAITNHFWVFAAASTNVGYTLKVTDTATGTVRQYVNPTGRAASAITDTSAFATCP